VLFAPKKYDMSLTVEIAYDHPKLLLEFVEWMNQGSEKRYIV
jgi:hypothetical protein